MSSSTNSKIGALTQHTGRSSHIGHNIIYEKKVYMGCFFCTLFKIICFVPLTILHMKFIFNLVSESSLECYKACEHSKPVTRIHVLNVPHIFWNFCTTQVLVINVRLWQLYLMVRFRHKQALLRVSEKIGFWLEIPVLVAANKTVPFFLLVLLNILIN